MNIVPLLHAVKGEKVIFAESPHLVLGLKGVPLLLISIPKSYKTQKSDPVTVNFMHRVSFACLSKGRSRDRQ